jgi:hypothetical protein
MSNHNIAPQPVPSSPQQYQPLRHGLSPRFKPQARKKEPRSLHRERGSFLFSSFLYHAATAPSQRGSVPAV